jgi:hypothetical protein
MCSQNSARSTAQVVALLVQVVVTAQAVAGAPRPTA